MPLQPLINDKVAELFRNTNEPYNLTDRAKALASWTIRQRLGVLDFMPSPEEQNEFHKWMDTFNANRALTLFSHAKELQRRCDAYIAKRQREGLRDDLIDRWITLEQDGLLRPGDASLHMQVILHAGTGTTEDVICNTVATLRTELDEDAFGDFVDQIDSSRIVRNGVAEATRKRPAAPARPFGVHKKAEIAGRRVRGKIHMISASMASVNRSPLVGDEPDKLILGRPNRSISFGSHYPSDAEHGEPRRCPGEHLAYMIAVPAVREALRPRPNILHVTSIPGAVVQIPELILG